MTWGRNKPQPPASTFSQVFPLIITLAVLAGLAWVGYQIYVSVAKMQDQASRQMGSKNVVFTREGVRVGVKHRENEDYVDATQSWVVKAWNLRGGGNDQAKSKPTANSKHK